MACDVVFIPSNEEMYPNGFIVNHFELNDLDKSMEGKHRQGILMEYVRLLANFLKSH